MKLDDLIYNLTIQGDIKLELWEGSEVIKEKTIEGTEDLSTEKLGAWKNYEIRYMFASPDNSLHIEFER